MRSQMVSKSLRMNASASPPSPDRPAPPRRVRSLEDFEPHPTPKKYIHVHHFKTTKLFGAWFNDPSKPGKKVRLFFGSHLTAYLAARAQDRAALKYKPHALDPQSIKLNFDEEDYDADKKLRKMLTCEEFGELLRKESRPKYTKMEPTPCLRQFLAHERARGNIPPSAVSSKEENVIPLRQYLKEVIQKRQQSDEDMEDASTEEESSDYSSESSDEEMDDPGVPAPKQKSKHALEVKRKKLKRGNRVVGFARSRTPRSPVAGLSEYKPLVWGQTRPRSKRYTGQEYKRLQQLFRLRKIDSTEKTIAENTKSQAEEAPTEPDVRLPPVEVENNNTGSLEPGTEGGALVPESPELQFRIKWHYKMHKLQQHKASRTSVEALPVEDVDMVEETKTSAAGGEDPPQSPRESTNLQFRSKWHYMMHKIQQLEKTTSTTSARSGKSMGNDAEF